MRGHEYDSDPLETRAWIMEGFRGGLGLECFHLCDVVNTHASSLGDLDDFTSGGRKKHPTIQNFQIRQLKNGQ